MGGAKRRDKIGNARKRNNYEEKSARRKEMVEQGELGRKN